MYVYVDEEEVLSEIDNDAILREMIERKISLPGGGIRMDELTNRLREIVFEMKMGRSVDALRLIEHLADEAEYADRALSNVGLKPVPMVKDTPAPTPSPA